MYTISTIIFSIYTSQIEEILERQKLGVLLGDLHIALLLFADDMVICADSRVNLEKELMFLTKILSNYETRNKLPKKQK